ncbi:MAG: beta/gamma crystallin-related protein [Acidobacteriota bacterium]
MTSTTTFAATLIALALASGLGAQFERQMGGLGLEVFEDKNFKGRSATFLNATPDLRLSGMDGRISSLRVEPGEIWEACTEPNYQGRCQVFSGTESDLAKRAGWNDAIRSVRRVRGGGGGDVGRGRGGNDTRGLELFAGTRFSGQRVLIDRPESNLRRMNFNDRASSLRVPRGEVWEICVNADFDDCRVVDSDIPDLSVIGLNREISSTRARPSGGGGVGRGGFPGPSRPRIVLYDSRNFQGRTTTIDDETPTLRWTNNNTAGSLRVVSGRWEICDEVRFSGRCVTVTQDVPDLARFGWNNRISSLRPR